ncbi:hypothetical protein [Cronobacter sakazakii]|uniref:hypothetical protein n=1 Tax=Cronobacter sakazakii TaxID=28141 RepID=UPI001F2AE634|nr:hypothetical protein [Cronobacter sakazakii]MDT3539824.1 hypothetical protein [Cronobacter sakazakii]MDT3625228.1 hypothetical protein [Cronobacter sakazakii]
MSELNELIASEIADFFAGFGGPGEPDIQSGEAQRLLTERVLSVLALRERAEPVAGNAAEFGDAYQGAREDLQIWKRRALEAEGEARRLAEINDYLVLQAQGEHRFGEPVVREPGALLHCAEQLHNGGTALYTAPPAPVVPDVETATCKYCGGSGYYRVQQSYNRAPCPCRHCTELAVLSKEG